MPRAPERHETDRLCMRRPTAADAEAIFAYASDPEVTRYVGWPTHSTLDETRGFLAHSDREWTAGPSGAYLIERRDAPGVIGGTGLHSAGENAAVTGYLLARPHWGRGYATEALRAMVAIGRRLGLDRLEANVHPDHLASVRVLEKAGFQREGLYEGGVLFPQLDAERPLEALQFVLRFERDAAR